jgi:hypothetical protein
VLHLLQLVQWLLLPALVRRLPPCRRLLCRRWRRRRRCSVTITTTPMKPSTQFCCCCWFDRVVRVRVLDANSISRSHCVCLLRYTSSADGGLENTPPPPPPPLLLLLDWHVLIKCLLFCSFCYYHDSLWFFFSPPTSTNLRLHLIVIGFRMVDFVGCWFGCTLSSLWFGATGCSISSSLSLSLEYIPPPPP